MFGHLEPGRTTSPVEGNGSILMLGAAWTTFPHMRFEHASTMVGSSVNPLVAEIRGSEGIGNRWLVKSRNVRFLNPN